MLFSRVGQAGELQSVSQVELRWLVTVREENQSNPKLQHLHRLVEQGEAVCPWKVLHDVLFFKDRIYLPRESELVLVLLKDFHEVHHEGFYKTLHRVQQVFRWNKMQED